jgi:superfamily II DNA or RNA helicase
MSSLREEPIAARRERAKLEKFAIRREPGSRSEYRVASHTGYFYRVVLRSLTEPVNSCDCPDFRSNQLGTCKHIEAILLRLSTGKKGNGALRFRPPSKERGEIYLEYGPEIRIRATGRAATLLKPWFEGDVLPGAYIERFPELLVRLRQLDGEVTIRPDVLEHVAREVELREGLREEKRMLARLDRFKLSLKRELYPFQKRGVLFAAFRARVLLADDMGLGKTVQAIGTASFLAARRGIREALVICPASVKYQWEKEVRRFCDLSAVVIEGGRRDRQRLYDSDVFFKIVNYEAVVRDQHVLSSREFDFVILDEAQRIKNWKTKTARVVKRLNKRYALVLTGTPLENRLEELFSIVQFLDNRLLGPLWDFDERYVARNEKGRVTGYQNLDEIRRRLAPILLRRRKDDVLRELPRRIDNNLYVGMTPQQLDGHDSYRKTIRQILQKKVLTEMDYQRLMICLNSMRMLCDSTWLLDQETHFATKLREFRQLIPELVDGGKKVLVFSCWERMTRLAAGELDRLGIRYVRFHGKIPPPKRVRLVDDFTEDPGCLVFLSTDAGGVGLNLQAASTVLNLDLPWNPAVLEQRIARAHRIGQKYAVNVVNLIAKGAIEERIWELMKLKRTLFQSALEGGPDAIELDREGRRRFVETVREIVAEPTFPEAAPRSGRKLPPLELAVALSALARGLKVESAGDRVRLQLELPRAQIDSVRQALVPVIRSLADALIGALGGPT